MTREALYSPDIYMFSCCLPRTRMCEQGVMRSGLVFIYICNSYTMVLRDYR